MAKMIVSVRVTSRPGEREEWAREYILSLEAEYVHGPNAVFALLETMRNIGNTAMEMGKEGTMSIMEVTDD
jgi:hypothetical protein